MRLEQLLNIQYPLIQGGMAHIATSDLASSVSNAGGLGIIGAGGMDASSLRQQIQDCKKKTSKPFGVNLMLMNPECDKMADVLIEEGVEVVTTGAGNPSKYMAKWLAAGIKVIPVVPSVALAKRMEKYGACAIICEGCEAGGHIGELTTMALVPQVCQAVSIPVIAAGGVASSCQVAASFCLGASGVQAGTIFLTSKECPIHDNYKQAIIKAKDTDTIVTGRINGTPVRILKNKMAKKYVSLEKRGASQEELEVYTLGSLKKAVVMGNTDEGSLMAGQVAGMISDIKDTKTIIEDLFKDVKGCLENALKRSSD